MLLKAATANGVLYEQAGVSDEEKLLLYEPDASTQ